MLAHRSRSFALALFFLALVIVPRALFAAWIHDPQANLQIAPTTTTQNTSSTISDGAGGAIVTWQDSRGGNYDVYAQRVSSSGAVAAGWPATGLLVSGGVGSQVAPVLVSDGANGAIIAWQDGRASGTNGNDIYAMRVNANGTLGAGWPAGGRLLSSANLTKDETGPAIASDGAGGAIVTWTLIYTYGSDNDIYAARVNSGGTLQWSVGLVTPSGIQQFPGIVSDAAGGAVICYQDNSSGNFDIKAIRSNALGAPVWGPNPVCLDASTQQALREISDGSGGAIIAWEDYRNGSSDVYVNRILSTGVVSPGWDPNGLDASNVSASIEQSPVIVSDGNHGALLAWVDGRYAGPDVFVQHVLGSGNFAPGWPQNGIELEPTRSGTPTPPAATADGSGGIIVGWIDARAGVYDLYASRITSNGSLAPSWDYGGTPVSIAASQQDSPSAAGDGLGGAIFAWTDYRAQNIQPNIYAQRIDLYGQLGNAEPSIASIKDIKSDQGGHVRIVWNASYLDADPDFAIGSYWIWRQSPITLAEAAVARGASWLDAPMESRWNSSSTEERAAIARRGLWARSTESGAAFAWEYLTSQPASGFAQYSYVAETARDSVTGSNPYTVFMVQARPNSGPAFWGSAPDSGYSVDNLPPLPPAPFTGYYSTGSTALHWNPNLESDFSVYRLYRGNSPSFVPGPSNFVTEKSDTGYTDAAGTPSYYKLAAVDAHGNVSGYSLLSPSGTLDIPSRKIPATVWLGPANPNPSRAGSTSVGFGLPREEAVTLRVFDASGRLVKELARGIMSAGNHLARWDGRDLGGHEAPSGIYFVSLIADGRTLRERLVSMH